MNSPTAGCPRQEIALVEQKIQQTASHPVHCLELQPNVILDLIFSHLVLSDLEGAVFPVSRRLAAHLRGRSTMVHCDLNFSLYIPQHVDEFLFLALHRNLLCVSFFNTSFGYPRFREIENAKVALLRLDFAQQCPRLEKAKLCIGVLFPAANETFCSVLDSCINSLSGCRFLRSFEYFGPSVPSLGRLKQLESLSVGYNHKYPESFLISLQNLSQLRILSFDDSSFSLDCVGILQTFTALENLELSSYPPTTAEELVKLPRLKSLSLLHHGRVEFSSAWRNFKTLERLILQSAMDYNDFGILPEIPSLKEVEILQNSYSSQSLHDYLSLNPQVISLVLYLIRLDDFNRPENLLQTAQFLEKHQNIQSFRVYDTLYRGIMWKNAAYSRGVTDRFIFRSSEHRQEFIDSLRRLAFTESHLSGIAVDQQRLDKKQKVLNAGN